MSNYPEELAMRAVVRLEDELMADLETDSSIVKHLLAVSRREAADAMVELQRADPEVPGNVKRLQNVVQRHFDLIRWISGTIQSGREAWKVLNSVDRSEIVDAIEGVNEAFDIPDVVGDDGQTAA